MAINEAAIGPDTIAITGKTSPFPSVVISQPPNNLGVKPNQPFLVMGRVTNQWLADGPVAIDSVTVQVDGGPPIEATLTIVPTKNMTTVTFKAFAQVTGGQDPHTLAVTALNDQGLSATSTVSVFTGPIFQVDAPALLLDISPFHLDPKDPKSRAFLDSLVSQIQQQLTPLAASLASVGKILAGPNIVITPNPQGVPVGRLGLWIEASTFPVLPPVLPAFPLPRLSDLAAAKCMENVPLLPVPNPSGPSPAFALSIPAKTLQTLLDSITPLLKAAASNQGASLDSVTVSANPPTSISTSFSGGGQLGPLDIPFSVSITESLGTRQLPDSVQMVPAVIGSSQSASVGGIPDWFAFFGSVFTLFALAAIDLGNQVGNQVTGIVTPLLAGIPASIPFRNPNLPAIPMPDFPRLELNWKSFGVIGAGIVGTGTTSIEARDQSMVALPILGARHIVGYQEDLSGGAGQTYNYSLVNLAPDPDKFTWQVSGTGADAGLIDRLSFDQAGSFGVYFPLPQQKDSHGKLLPVKPGKYPFTLTVNAIETSGVDISKKLSASNSIPVQVEVKPNPNVPP